MGPQAERDDREHPGGARGYLAVLRAYPGFRRLFVARGVSLLGDWFSLIAVVALLREVSESDPKALSGILILRLLPIFLAGPVAGAVADRFSRKTIMIVTDLVRCTLVLGMIAAPLVSRPVAFVFLLTSVQVVALAFSEPARSAALPQLISKRELSTANAMSAMMWSLMFALGAALGGVVADQLGWRAALVFDAGTYLVSAWLVAGIVLPARTREVGRVDWKTLTGIRDVGEGFRFIAQRPPVAAVIALKAGWGITGAATLFLALFGERVYAVGGRPDLGVSLLFTARALGTAIGPAVARRVVVDETPQAMRWLLTIAFLWPVAWYLAFSWVTSTAAAALCVLLAHGGGSVLWVYSTVLLQRMVSDRFLGRVISTDFGLATLAISISTWLFGALADAPGADLRVLVRWMALAVLIPAAAWFVAAGRWKIGVEAEGTSA